MPTKSHPPLPVSGETIPPFSPHISHRHVASQRICRHRIIIARHNIASTFRENPETTTVINLAAAGDKLSALRPLDILSPCIIAPASDDTKRPRPSFETMRHEYDRLRRSR